MSSIARLRQREARTYARHGRTQAYLNWLTKMTSIDQGFALAQCRTVAVLSASMAISGTPRSPVSDSSKAAALHEAGLSSNCETPWRTMANFDTGFLHSDTNGMRPGYRFQPRSASRCAGYFLPITRILHSFKWFSRTARAIEVLRQGDERTGQRRRR